MFEMQQLLAFQTEFRQCKLFKGNTTTTISKKLHKCPTFVQFILDKGTTLSQKVLLWANKTWVKTPKLSL
jgi:hypothetical protein